LPISSSRGLPATAAVRQPNSTPLGSETENRPVQRSVAIPGLLRTRPIERATLFGDTLEGEPESAPEIASGPLGALVRRPALGELIPDLTGSRGRSAAAPSLLATLRCHQNRSAVSTESGTIQRGNDTTPAAGAVVGGIAAPRRRTIRGIMASDNDHREPRRRLTGLRAAEQRGAPLAPVVRRTLGLIGNPEDKVRAVFLLKQLIGSDADRVVIGDGLPCRVQLTDASTSGGKMVQGLVDSEKELNWNISSAQPAHYYNETHMIHLNVKNVSESILPARGTAEEPEGKYPIAGNEHITLGHEMNHALRDATGHAKKKYVEGDHSPLSTDQWVKVAASSNNKLLNYYMPLEEAENIGLKKTLETEPGTAAWGGSSENSFLQQHGMEARIGYFQVDSLANRLNRLDYLRSLTRTTAIRFRIYQEKLISLTGIDSYNNPDVSSAVEGLTARREVVDDQIAQNRAAERKKEQWHDHQLTNIEPKLAELDSAFAGPQFDASGEWSSWVSLGNRGQIADAGFSPDWDNIVDPPKESPLFHSEWYTKVRAINAETARREAARAAAEKKRSAHGRLMSVDGDISAENPFDAEMENLHAEILMKIQEEGIGLEASLIIQVSQLLGLMRHEVEELRETCGGKPGYSPLLNLLTTWAPVVAFDADAS
jgi:hypothetical protein